MTDKTTASSSEPSKPRFHLVPLREERLAHKLTLAFGFMSFIPILLVVWAMVSHVDLGIAIYPIAASAFIGYFFVARRMIQSVISLTEQAKQLASGRSTGQIQINEGSEIGELARSFNRITHELEHKISELESSRSVIKRLLSKIGNALVSYEGIDNLLDLIVENAGLALEAQVGSLMLLNGEKQELEIKSFWSSGGSPKPAKTMKLGEGIAGWVAKDGRPMHGTCSPAGVGLVEEQAKEGAVLCVPLTLREKPLGVLTMFRQDPKQVFLEDDEMLLANIGSQVAVAIENYRLNLDMERTYLETVRALAMAVEAKEPYTAGHSKRVGHYAVKIAEQMGLDEEIQKVLNNAGLLHDVGKIGIRDDILLKPQALSPDEARIMHQHSVIGEAILHPLRSLSKVAELVRHHHERFDGTGYPDGLKGEAIPLGARIVCVADTYDAMSTDRPYRKRLTLDEVRTELRKESGKQFDPQVVDAFLRFLSDKEHRLAGVEANSTPA